MPTKYVRIDDLAIHYVHAGATTLPDVPPPLNRGAALLFIHGAGGSAALWSKQIGHFGKQHSPLAVDLPAHGRSCGLDALDSVPANATLVARFLQAVKAPPAILVGHSFGGQIALELALSQPSLVRGVITIGTAARPEIAAEYVGKLRQVVQGRLGQQFDTPFFGSQPDMAVMREFWTEMVKTDPRSRLTDLLAYQASDLAGRLGKLRTPAMIIQGEADQLCPRARADELAGGIPGARLEVIATAGHVAHLERPDQVNQAIDAFLAGI